MRNVEPLGNKLDSAAMNARVLRLQAQVAATLNGLPGVFSTVQWGGRAYKVPGPGNSRKRPRLVAHVYLNKAGDAVMVDFKLSKRRANETIEKHSWIERHSFRTLASSGWISAEVRTAAHGKTLAMLLKESRELYPSPERATQARLGAGRTLPGSDVIGRRIGSLIREKKASGWRPEL